MNLSKSILSSIIANCHIYVLYTIFQFNFNKYKLKCNNFFLTMVVLTMQFTRHRVRGSHVYTLFDQYFVKQLRRILAQMHSLQSKTI